MPNPDRVELVRQRLALTKSGLADLLGIERKTLQRFEATGFMSEEVLDKLSTASGYPKSFFYKQSAELPNQEAVSFRSHRSLTAGPRDAALAAAALAFEIDDWIHSQFDLPTHTLPQLSNLNPAGAAMALRAHWGIGNMPIENMINVLESHGVRVFSLVEETRHLDAYSFWRNERPYVFLNTLKTAEHNRFDAAHELGHLVMHQHGGPSHRSAEEEANSFASAFLIPPDELRARARNVTTLAEIIRAKKIWKVSASALNYALRKNELISEWTYRGNYIQLNKRGRSEEPDGIERETSQIWKKILTTLWQEGITLREIGKLLDIPEREISSLLFGVAAKPSEHRPPRSNALRAVK